MTGVAKSIVVERRGRVAIIRLDRPEVLNALSRQVCEELVAVTTDLDRDVEVGAIVLTGSDRAFAAGADIAEMEPQGFVDMFLSDWFAGWDAFARTRTPLIAAVGGYALGGGCELAMMCDIIIAAESARFGQPEINLGVIPGMGGTQRLTRAVGKYKAADLILTGRPMTADEAERIGLVSRVVPAADLLDAALEVAESIAAKSLPAVYAAKESLNVALESTLAEGIRFERRAIHSTFALQDQKEGMAAFREKRRPDFRHR